MAFLPSLRKTLRPSPRAVFPGEVKSAAGAYFGDLQRQLSAATGRDWSPERAVAEGYERLVWVFKPVDTISNNQSARRMVALDGTDESDDDPMVRLLNGQANPLEIGPVLRKRLSAQILLSKPGAFVEVGSSRGGTPFRLDLLPPGRVRIVPGDEAADPRDVKSLVDHFEVLSKDGTRARPIDPENVRWFRNPHPLDPYSGMTPLEAAGMSVELDHFSRLYNVMFLRQDGRPGGIIAVKGDLDEVEEARIERKFEKGAQAAGKLTVLTADGLSYVDPSAKPRDMSYVQLAKNAKIELLSAFGVSETVMGYSGDKTFANAEQEMLGFWTVTMPAHLAIITQGFDADVTDERRMAFDLSDVEVLERAKDAKLARMREEYTAGLRSLFSYAQEAGIKGIEDTELTRSVYIAAGKTPLPVTRADQVLMGLGPSQQKEEPGAASGPVELPGPAAPAPAALPAASPAGDATGGNPEGAVPAGPGGPQAALAAARAAAGGSLPAEGSSPARLALAAAQATAGAKTAAAVLETKAIAGSVRLHVVGGKARAATRTDDVDEAAREALEDRLRTLLTELSAGWVERAAARVGSVKSRKHTRHWQPEGDRAVDSRVATKAIDPTYAVDEQTWEAEARDQTSPVLVAAALVAATRTWENLGGEGALPRQTARRVAASARQVAAFVGMAAVRQAERLARAINDADQQGMGMEEIVAGVRGFAARLSSWAEGVAVQGATAATETARSQGAKALAGVEDVVDDDTGLPSLPTDDATPFPTNLDPLDPADDPDPLESFRERQVVGRWRSRRDRAVRATHVVADGQEQPVGGLYEVGGYLLRFPGDPLAPARETANCRCHVQYRSKLSGRFVTGPSDELLEAAR